MSIKIAVVSRRFATLFVVVGAILLAAALTDWAFAQGGPFGIPRPRDAPVPVGGIAGWLLSKQGEFYRQFSGLIRAAKADGEIARLHRSASRHKTSRQRGWRGRNRKPPWS
jgi:hypothetical protein